MGAGSGVVRIKIPGGEAFRSPAIYHSTSRKIRSEVTYRRHHLFGDQAQVVEVEQVEDLEVRPAGSQLGEAGEVLHGLLGRSRRAVDPKLVGLAGNGRGSAVELLLVAPMHTTCAAE